MTLSRLIVTSAFLLPPVLFLGCDSKSGETGTPADTDTDSDADTDTDSDSDSDSDTDADTSFMIVTFEGAVDLTVDSWTGEESEVAYDVTMSEEWCRVTNPNTGVPSAVSCADCDYVFDLSYAAGSMTGDKCAGTGWSAGDHDGEEWTYAFLPEYVGYYGYTYYYTGYGFFPFAYGYESEEGAHLDYRSFGGYAYYFNQ